MKTQKIQINKKDERVALVFENNSFSVYIERENYVQGRDVKTWKRIKNGLDRETAEKLFTSRSK